MMSVGRGGSRRVVFHADDFGMNTAVNEGILTAFRDGVLTSTSLLANAPAAKSACQAWPTLIRQQSQDTLRSSELRRELDEPNLPFDLGIHLNLTQGRPLTGEKYPAQLLDPDGNFPGIGSLFARLNRVKQDPLKSVQSELHAQIEWMCDESLRPSHLNGHQYIEIIPQISSMIPEILRRYSISSVRVALERGLIRNVLFQGDIASWGLAMVKRHYAKSFRRRISRENLVFADQFFGTSHAGRIDRKLVLKFLDLSADAELTEIGVHPAIAPAADAVSAGDPWFDPLAKLRPQELDWLCRSDFPNELVKRRVRLGRIWVREK
jgi:predicted glycoside hydrolase/deacetylase ChbG (UPF0249 family)